MEAVAKLSRSRWSVSLQSLWRLKVSTYQTSSNLKPNLQNQSMFLVFMSLTSKKLSTNPTQIFKFSCYHSLIWRADLKMALLRKVLRKFKTMNKLIGKDSIPVISLKVAFLFSYFANLHRLFTSGKINSNAHMRSRFALRNNKSV